MIALALVITVLAFQAAWWNWRDTLVTIAAACEIFYVVFVCFKLLLVVASYLPARASGGTLPDVDDPDLPTFTILLPNVREKPHTLRALLESLAAMRYPHDKLQLLLLVEHWDSATQDLFRDSTAPSAGLSRPPAH